MEAIAAAQMDGEVPSMSGSHGNLSDKSHHGIVERVKSDDNNWFSTFHFALHAKGKRFGIQQRRVIGMYVMGNYM